MTTSNKCQRVWTSIRFPRNEKFCSSFLPSMFTFSFSFLRRLSLYFFFFSFLLCLLLAYLSLSPLSFSPLFLSVSPLSIAFTLLLCLSFFALCFFHSIALLSVYYALSFCLFLSPHFPLFFFLSICACSAFPFTFVFLSDFHLQRIIFYLFL